MRVIVFLALLVSPDLGNRQHIAVSEEISLFYPLSTRRSARWPQWRLLSVPPTFLQMVQPKQQSCTSEFVFLKANLQISSEVYAKKHSQHFLP